MIPFRVTPPEVPHSRIDQKSIKNGQKPIKTTQN